MERICGTQDSCGTPLARLSTIAVTIACSRCIAGETKYVPQPPLIPQPPFVPQAKQPYFRDVLAVCPQVWLRVDHRQSWATSCGTFVSPTTIMSLGNKLQQILTESFSFKSETASPQRECWNENDIRAGIEPYTKFSLFFIRTQQEKGAE